MRESHTYKKDLTYTLSYEIHHFIIIISYYEMFPVGETFIWWTKERVSID